MNIGVFRMTDFVSRSRTDVHREYNVRSIPVMSNRRARIRFGCITYKPMKLQRDTVRAAMDVSHLIR